MTAVKRQRLNPVFYTEKKYEFPDWDWFVWLNETGECRMLLSDIPGIENVPIGGKAILVRGDERIEVQRVPMGQDWADDYEVELRHLGEEILV